MGYNYTYIPLSRDNTYFIMAIFHNRYKIIEKIELARAKLRISSMVLRTDIAYKRAVDLIIQEIFLQKIVNKVHNALAKVDNGDIIFTKVENIGAGDNRQFYRKRNTAIQQFAYRLVQQGLTDKRCFEFRRIFSEFSDLPREMKIHEINNKKEV